VRVAARLRETQPSGLVFRIISFAGRAMNQNIQHHSNAWVTFTYGSFGASAFLVAIGVYFLPVDLWIKGYLAMGIVMLIQSCVTLTKTVRDVHESSRFVNRIEDAKAERLLMEVSKAS